MQKIFLRKTVFAKFASIQYESGDAKIRPPEYYLRVSIYFPSAFLMSVTTFEIYILKQIQTAA